MWTPVLLTNGSTYPYGLGWRVDSVQGIQRIHHSGSLPGFRSEYARFPQSGISVVVLTNGEGDEPTQMAQDIAFLYIRSVKTTGNKKP